ncbi:MAG: META domain-containing protein [Thauera sp.]|nr:META domain-containing protein [Thauera sp.]
MKASSLLALTLLAGLVGGCSLFSRSLPAPATEASTQTVGERPADPALALDPQPPVEFRCGERTVELRYFGELATLGVDGKVFTLRPERSASGMRMVSVDDERTGIWVKGNSALLSLAGVEQPECRRVAERPLFRAVGNEPAWRLDIGAQGLELIADGGASRAFASAPLIVEVEGMRSYQGTSAGGELEALVFDRVCVDTMSGMTHPNSVEVRWQDRVLRGCGGDPARLLQGEPWEVVELDGRAVADPARMTLAFAADGRLAGLAACNRYFGSYGLSGEGLRLSPLGATKMACEPRAMEDEQRFMAAAARVTGFALAGDGRLELRAGDRVVMRARRAGGR